MISRQPHPFFDLEPVDRAEWVGLFCDKDRVEPSPFDDAPFPRLRQDLTPHSWLINQVRRWRRRRGLRDRLRDSVYRLIATKALPGDLVSQSQAIGEVLLVARGCHFIDVADHLKGWIRGDVSFEAGVGLGGTYTIAQQEVSLRRTIWSLLIGWHATAGLEEYLKRDLNKLLERVRHRTVALASGDPCRNDLARQGGDCAMLLYRELGRLDPEEAILMTPPLLRWPRAYWKEAVGQFVANLSPALLVTNRYREAWTRCFGEIVFDSKLELLIAKDLVTGRLGPLAAVLRDQGLEIEMNRSAVELRCDERSGNRLRLELSDMEAERKSASRLLTALFNRSFTSDVGFGRLAMEAVRRP